MSKLRDKLLEKKKREVIKAKDLLSTGSVLLNLNLSGRRIGGIPKGTYVLLAGGSDTGKTWLAKTICAEAAINEEFSNYRIIWNDPERGSLMDIRKFFGKSLKNRLEERNPETIEDFYYSLDDDLENGQPFIEVLDSMDALESKEDEKLFQKEKSASQKGKDGPGSYAVRKAKENSRNLRRIANRLHKNGSILIIIAQLRSNMAYGNQYEPHILSGGMALKYYCHTMLWTSQKGSITTDHKGKKREQGIYMQVKVKKNRLSGRKRTAIVPIYHSHGIDDVGSCVDYLLEEGHWKKRQGVGIDAKELGLQGSRESLIQQIEEEDLEQALHVVVSKVFNSIEEAISIKRKKRYG